MAAVTCAEWSCEWSAVDAVIAELQAAGLEVSGDLATADVPKVKPAKAALEERHFMITRRLMHPKDHVSMGFTRKTDGRADVELMTCLSPDIIALVQECWVGTQVERALRSAGAVAIEPWDLTGHASGRFPQPSARSEIIGCLRAVVRFVVLPCGAIGLAYLLGVRAARACIDHFRPEGAAWQDLPLAAGLALGLVAWRLVVKWNKNAGRNPPQR